MNDKSGTNQPATRPPSSPKSGASIVSVALICGTILVAVYWLKPAKRTQPLRRLWTPLVVNTENKEMVTPDSLRLEFWTPSAKTKDYLSKSNLANSSWEVLENDEPVMQFGRLLRSDPSIVGYRRAEVWGHGRTSLKPGWWWSVTVWTNYSVSNLSSTYRKFWKTPSGIFVEVIDNRGHEEE